MGVNIAHFLGLNLSSYTLGTYMLRITGNGGVKVLRFVKE